MCCVPPGVRAPWRGEMGSVVAPAGVELDGRMDGVRRGMAKRCCALGVGEGCARGPLRRGRGERGGSGNLYL